MIQKNEPLEINEGRLSEDTRKLLAKNITERLYKREKFRQENMTLDRIIKVQAREIAAFILCAWTVMRRLHIIRRGGRRNPIPRKSSDNT